MKNISNKYAILANPGHNRVYFAHALKMAISELTLAAKTFQPRRINLEEIKSQIICGIQYIVFTSNEELSEKEKESISKLSFFYALFKVSEGENLCFYPIEKVDYEKINPSISSILKYQGKTNEIFTRMMINCAMYSYDYRDIKKISLFDPVCGKGTSLFEGAVLGYDVTGCEIVPKLTAEAKIYFKKFLESEKIKHKETRQGYNVKIKGKSLTGDVFKFVFNKNKDQFKKEENIQSFTLCNANSSLCDKIFKFSSFDIIVGDLPYGIVHASSTEETTKTGKNQGKAGKTTIIKAPSRNPAEMIEECLTPWRNVLKKGGIMALSWNTFVLSRENLSAIITKAGFEVLQGAIYDNFVHRVDQAIMRDVIFAKKL